MLRIMMLFLAQAGAQAGRVNQIDGIPYSETEGSACAGEIQVIRQDLADRRHQFMRPSHNELLDQEHHRLLDNCLAQVRAQAARDQERRRKEEARLEAIRQNLYQSGAKTREMRQLAGIQYTDAEAQACLEELRKLQDATRRREHPSESDRGTIARYGGLPYDDSRAPFEKCLSELRSEANRQRQALEREFRQAREAEARDLARQLVEKPETRRLDLSGLLCLKQDARQEILNAIAKDKKYSAIGGAVDLSRRAELQEELAGIDDEIRTVRAVLKRYKTMPLGCRDARLGDIVECLTDDAPERCSDPGLRAHVLAVQMLME